jgi:selenocysteine lyase/cysteine desulfurase
MARTGAKGAVRPRLIGDGTTVPLLPGGEAPYTNLDYAASAPALREVAEAVAEFLPWYASVHRGAGFKSQVASAAYDGARESLRRFVGARPDDTVVITRHTTDALNLIARGLPEGAGVITFAFEHHANLLPWRGRRFRHLPIPPGPEEMLEALEMALEDEPAGLVAVTGASNVTGEIPPLARVKELCRRHGARLLVDAAQLAPHRPIDMAATGIDYLALSGHKLYAPYGAGALVGRADWLDGSPPYLQGGGAVEFVTADGVLWKDGPDRHEAGSPNVVGAVALGVACETLSALGMPALVAEEAELHAQALRRLRAVPGLTLYSTWDFEYPHIGVLTFNLRGYHHSKVAAILSAEYGIGVRDGCFCAHPLMLHLMEVDDAQADQVRREILQGRRIDVPGGVRASLGLDSRAEDVDRLADALAEISLEGPRWTYQADDEAGTYAPTPDPRPWPQLPPGLRLIR